MLLKHYCLLLLSCLLLACQPATPKVAPTPIIEETAPTKPVLPPIPYSLDTPHFDQLLAQNKGNVVLINLWATWCKPCIKELPDLEKLHQKYQDQAIKVIAISIEDETKADTLVRPFWKKMELSMDNYLLQSDQPETFINHFDKIWLGMVPTSYIFNQNGEKVETITGTLSYEAFEKKVLAVKHSEQ